MYHLFEIERLRIITAEGAECVAEFAKKKFYKSLNIKTIYYARK